MRIFFASIFSAFLGAVIATWSQRKDNAAADLARRLEARLEELAAVQAPASGDHGGRRLGGIYVTSSTITASSGSTWTGAGQACMAVPMVCGPTAFFSGSVCSASTGPVATLDLSIDACNGKYCPDCFIFQASSNSQFNIDTGTANGLSANAGSAIVPELTLQKCSTAKWGSSNRMGSPPMTTAVREYLFINQHFFNSVKLTDGAASPNSFLLPANEYVSAYCGTVSGNALSFPYTLEHIGRNRVLDLTRQGTDQVTSIDTSFSPTQENIASRGASTTGCMSIPMIQAGGSDGYGTAAKPPFKTVDGAPALTLDLSESNRCGGGICPACFVFHQGTASSGAAIGTDDATFTLTKCSQARVPFTANPTATAIPLPNGAMGAADNAQVLREFMFINLSLRTVTIKDNAETPSAHALAAGGSVTAYCASMDSTLTLPNELKNKLSFHV